MNLPDNLSATATSIYNLLSAQGAGQTKQEIAAALAKQPATEERYKAVSTADSLVVKGIITAEKVESDTTYTLVKSATEVGPNDDADTNENYAEKTDVNAEEQRMIDLLENNDKKLPETKLFELYEQGQLPATNVANAADNDAIEKALQELTEAGVVKKDGEAYSIQQ